MQGILRFGIQRVGEQKAVSQNPQNWSWQALSPLMCPIVPILPAHNPLWTVITPQETMGCRCCSTGGYSGDVVSPSLA